MIHSELDGLFYLRSEDKELIISCDGVNIANEDIESESMELTESLCSDKSLQFGRCEASVFKIRLFNTNLSMKGKWIEVSIKCESAEKPIPIGRYKVVSDVLSDDRSYRSITSYDALNEILKKDFAGWYNSLVFPVTVKQLRDSFFSYAGIEQADISLVNDEILIEETIKPSSLAGKVILNAVCEINGCFGHIGRDGKFKYVILDEIVSGLYPSDTLFPSDELFPKSGNTYGIPSECFSAPVYQDYFSKRIEKIIIRQQENDIGAIYPDSDADINTYIVQGNFLVYGKSAEELEKIAQNMFNVVSGICYRPFKVEAVGNPFIEVGDAICISTDNDIVSSYVLNRRLSGTLALSDYYEAQGTEFYQKNSNSTNAKIEQLRGKTNILERTVEETRLEIKDTEKDISSQITQMAGKIETEVQRAAEAEENLSTKISQTAESVSAEATRATGAEISLSARISLSTESIASEMTRATGAESLLSSKIMQTVESVSSEISRATGVESALSTRISQTVKEIDLKVTKGKISSELSLESGQVTLKSNRFVLEATNCSISKEGNITAKNVDLTGKITADSGKIAGFAIDLSGLRSGKTSINDGKAGVYLGIDGIAVGYGGIASSAFRVSERGDVDVGSSGGVTIHSNTPITFEASTAYIKHLTTDSIEFSSSKTSIISTYSVLGKFGGQIGFFGNNGAPKKTVQVISTPSSSTAATNASKINEIINALKAYNLIG